MNYFFWLLPLLLLGCGLPATTMAQSQLNNPRNLPYTWDTDTTRRTVPLEEITLVVPRGTFPAIDYPEFLGKEAGQERFFAHEPVIAVAIEGVAKAYPLNMLTMHEMSNDTLGGIPILPTYCPLCNASVVYDRRLRHEGQDYELTFEVSGMLRNSDMVMADAQTETWWQQLTGTGLVGELAGAELTVIPSLVISVSDFFARYPEGRILSPDTGTPSESRYGTNPYVGYDGEDQTPFARYFAAEQLDLRLPPMERIIEVEGSEGYRIYPFSTIADQEVINDEYDGRPLVIFYKEGTVSVLDAAKIAESRAVGSATLFSPTVEGRVLTFQRKRDHFVDRQTKSTWDITGRAIDGPLAGTQLTPLPHSNHFAFAWLVFHPESEIYKP